MSLAKLVMLAFHLSAEQKSCYTCTMHTPLKNKKHLFFDMDDTVTMTRSPMEDDVYNLYASLTQNVVIVSGAVISQIKKQVRGLPFYFLGQNGNQATDPSGVILWEEKLGEKHTKMISDHILLIQKKFPRIIKDTNDLVEYRGAQISYSLIGHNEEISKKKACDPNQEIRKAILNALPLETNEVEVKIGGTTCLDYFQKGKTKGHNIARLISTLGWNDVDCVYFGDSLFSGGNDESVIGVIDTYPVRNHRETFEILKTSFA